MRTHLTACWRGGDATQRPGYNLQFGYHAEVIDALKSLIPASDRTWTDDTKTWWVSEGHEEALESVFPNFHSLVFDQIRLL